MPSHPRQALSLTKRCGRSEKGFGEGARVARTRSAAKNVRWVHIGAGPSELTEGFVTRGSWRAIFVILSILAGIVVAEFAVVYVVTGGASSSLRQGLFFAWAGTGIAGALVGGAMAGFGAPVDTETLFTAGYNGRLRDERRRRMETVEGGDLGLVVAGSGLVLFVLGIIMHLAG